jgi:membrane protein DedA with SNARE-associated domain/rhodanese-related sulfurtransferase
MLQTFVLTHGAAVMFANVLIESFGVPIPAFPTLVIVGACSGITKTPVLLLVALAASGAMLGDIVWFWSGRRFGRHMLRGVCRLSLSPDNCVSNTGHFFERWGARMLLVSKFVPGMSTVALAMAGASGVKPLTFLALDGCGALIWAATGILLGALGAPYVSSLMHVLDMFRGGLFAVVVTLGLYLTARWWRRRALVKALRMARITAADLHALTQTQPELLIVDARAIAIQEIDPFRLPGAQVLSVEKLDSSVSGWPRDQQIVMYCSCPNEISAALMARRFMRLGFTHVTPLHGGIDAWRRAGYPVEQAVH